MATLCCNRSEVTCSSRKSGSSRSLNTGSTAIPSASSAATNRPLSSTSSTTASSLNTSVMITCAFMSELHLPEHHLQDVLQRHDARLAPVAAQHDGQPLPAALHPLQRDFQPQV